VTGSKKSLGQHWLRDAATLAAIADCAALTPDDTVVEIGPGLGTLTEVLSQRAGRVVAVELDGVLAKRLAKRQLAVTEVEEGDFLHYPLESLPEGYKIIGNIPYYITGKIVRRALETTHRPSLVVLLVQKEVAERLTASPGDMSILSVMAQYHAEVWLGPIVPAALFDPPPQVDSQVVVLRPHISRAAAADEQAFARMVKAGFSARRKKLRTALAGGLNVSVETAENLLQTAAIGPNWRAQQLTLDQWRDLAAAARQLGLSRQAEAAR
jgi:16S rRNA (adenine1518-N6/adenine1519-N6)-dimethyltransferase